MAARIKVMTFNLRIRVTADENNFFDFRRDKILNLINDEKPDLIGFQEANDFMVDWLKTSLTDYYVVGHGRDKRMHGEGAHVAFRKDKFDLCGFEEKWLSLTPNTPASRVDGVGQSTCPRVLSRADLLYKDSETPISFFNIHTDHMGEMSRVVECMILAQEMLKSPYPVIATGDFNAFPESQSITLLLQNTKEHGIIDATSEIPGSFHHFKGDCGTHKIDYIFTNLPCNKEESYAIPDDDSCGHYYSDHNALCAWVEV